MGFSLQCDRGGGGRSASHSVGVYIMDGDGGGGGVQSKAGHRQKK